MFASSGTHRGVPAEIRLADNVPPSTDGSVEVRFRRERGPGIGAPSWRAVITVHPETSLDPEDVLANAHDFCVEDRDGPLGVVDEIRFGEGAGGGTLHVATGWFGRRRLTLPFADVEEILPGERKLIVRRREASVPGR